MYHPVRVKQVIKHLPMFKESITTASNVLNSWGFDIFCAELEKHVEYSHMELNSEHHVKHCNFPGAPARRFFDRCGCPKRVSFMVQCRHDLKVSSGVFCVEKFDGRWMSEDHIEAAATETGK